MNLDFSRLYKHQILLFQLVKKHNFLSFYFEIRRKSLTGWAFTSRSNWTGEALLIFFCLCSGDSDGEKRVWEDECEIPCQWLKCRYIITPLSLTHKSGSALTHWLADCAATKIWFVLSQSFCWLFIGKYKQFKTESILNNNNRLLMGISRLH